MGGMGRDLNTALDEVMVLAEEEREPVLEYLVDLGFAEVDADAAGTMTVTITDAGLGAMAALSSLMAAQTIGQNRPVLRRIHQASLSLHNAATDLIEYLTSDGSSGS